MKKFTILFSLITLILCSILAVGTTYAQAPDMSQWVGKWFSLKGTTKGIAFSEPDSKFSNDAGGGTVFMEIWNWDASTGEFQFDTYKKNTDGTWKTKTNSLHFLAGTAVKFLLWYDESNDNSETAFTAVISGMQKNGILTGATFKSLGGLYTDVSSDNTQYSAGVQMVNGNVIAASKVPVPPDVIIQHGTSSSVSAEFLQADLMSTQSPQAATARPIVSVSPMSVNLGSVKVGGSSHPKTVTIKNTGNTNLTITSISISGANQSEFNQASNCTTIPAKSSCPVTVTFSPVAPFGKKSAVLSILSNDPKKPNVSVKLLGQVLPPKITVTPQSVNCGSVSVGSTSSHKIVTIKDTGISDLAVGAITITGANAAEFSETNNCSTVTQGTSCTINVTLSPTSAGNKTAVMNIPSNDPKKPVTAVKLTGKGSGGSASGAVNVQAALAFIMTKGLNQNFTISGTYSSYQATGNGNETVTPATATTLNGTPVMLTTSTFAGTIIVKGHNVALSETDTAYLTTTNYDFVAVEHSANSAYSGSSAYYTTYTTVAYPTTVKAGASGLAATTKLYSDPSMATQIGTGKLSYSVAADGSSTSTLLATFVRDEYDMSNTHTTKETITYRVDTSGHGSLVSAGRSNDGGNANSTAGTTPYNITFTSK